MIYERFQGNRNPFVDRPEWVRRAFWPELQVARFGSTVMVRWPAEYSAAVLEFGVQTTNATKWQPSNGSRINDGNTVTVTINLPPAPGSGYYRLRLP